MALLPVCFRPEVDTLICGGIGAGAQMALAQAGIRLYGGVSGSADEAVNGAGLQESWCFSRMCSAAIMDMGNTMLAVSKSMGAREDVTSVPSRK